MRISFYDKLIAHLNTYDFKNVDYYATNKKIIIVAKKPYQYRIIEFIYINKPKTNKLKIIIVDE